MSLRNRVLAGSALALAFTYAFGGCKGSAEVTANGEVSSSGGSGSGGGSGGSSGASSGGDAAVTPPPPAPGTFVDNFTWSGVHAAVVNGGKGTAVHWNSTNWDVTGDTHAIAVMGQWSNTPTPNAAAADGTPTAGLTNTNSGHAVYIHKAAKPCDPASTGVCSSLTDDTALVPGGDGSPGIAVMHVDEQDIVGARLRNPMVITSDKPGIVRVRGPRMVTTGGWWELALTPADRVIGAENTVVESQGLKDGLGDPGGSPNSPDKGAGPGHDPQEESFNLVVTASHDFACEDFSAEEGTLTRLAIKSLVKTAPAGLTGGYQVDTGYRYNMFNPKNFHNGVFFGDYQRNLIRPGLDGRKKLTAPFLNTDGSEDMAKVTAANFADFDNLYLWQFEFSPTGVDVKADFNDGQGLALVEHFALGVPWPVVHVALMGAAYQADHHPQVQGCYVPNPFTQRELKFATFQASPLQYTSVAVFPPDGAAVDASGNVQLCNGGSCGRWMRYDMRDTRNWGAPDTVTVNGQPVTLKKANDVVFKFETDYAHGSASLGSKGVAPEKSFDLYVPISDDVTKATFANFVYNVLGKGVATLTVNGHAVGKLPAADSVIGAWVKNDVRTDAGCTDYTCMSVRRSVAIDPKFLTDGAQNGVAHIQVAFDQTAIGKGTFFDRIQLELMH